MDPRYFAEMVGWAVIVCCTFIGVGALACVGVQQCWKAACGARRMVWLSEAMQHYDKIKPMPGKGTGGASHG